MSDFNLMTELFICMLVIMSNFIENMLHMLHATYIKHDLYADFFLRLKKSLKEFFSQQIHSLR